ncbi:hypothetical protein HY641_05225 [Candidatus Woesearchaeota archaeon]|nr:hypothetical protein [Candidatus Woesearchaeota archaeon]
MQSDLPKQQLPTPLAFPDKDLAIVRHFTDAATKTRPDLVVTIALSRVERGHPIPAGALPVVVIIDDCRRVLTTNDVMTYVTDMRSIISSISGRIHLETVRLTDHWKMTRDKDPAHLDFLRNSIVYFDTGFLGAAQILLAQGRLRPSMESTGVHYANAQRAFKSSTIRLMQAAVDLYWAAIDAAHAAILHHGGTAPAPAHVAETLREMFVKHRKLEKEYPQIMERLFLVYKDVTHGTLTELRGEAYDALYKETVKFVERMRKLIAKNA